MAEVLPLGLERLVLRFATRLEEGASRAARALAADLRADPLPGQIEVAAGLGSLCVVWDGPVPAGAAAALAARAAARDWAAAPPPPGRVWEVPAAFDGPALEEVGAMSGLGAAGVVAAICAAPLDVLAIGFAPGQPYLGILPPALDLPRLPAVVPQVPQGTIALALRQLVQFVAPAPTGWRAIGQTAFCPVRPGAAEPFVLAAGDRLRYRPVPAAEILARRAAGDPAGGARQVAP